MSSASAKIELDCPGCGKRLSLAAEYPARDAQCPSCATLLKIPCPTPPAASVLEYARPGTTTANSPIPTDDARANVRVDPTDPFAGNRFKNLYLPLIVIVGSISFHFATEIIFATDHSFSSYDPDGPKAALVSASKDVALDAVINLPVMLIACVLAVWLLDAAFGPLFPAILKLFSIALSFKGVFGAIFLLGWLIGILTGSEYYSGWSIGLGETAGILLGMLAYFRLFMYFFDLDLGEAWQLILLIWFTQTFLGWMTLAAAHSFFGQR